MRSLLWCALAFGIVNVAAAQGGTSMFEESRSVTVTGFAVGSWSWDRNMRTNTFTGSKLAVSLFRPWSDYLYLFGQLTTSLGQDEATGEPTTEIEIDNLIVSWTPPGASALNLSFGRFDAPIGFERDDEPLNLLPTNSFNFELARPSKLTGLIARYTGSPRWGATVYAANGWDAPIDDNRGKTVGARVDLLPTEGVAIGLNGLYGPEVPGTDAQQRTLLSADATLQPVPELIIGAEGNVGRQLTGATAAKWSGVAATVFYRLGTTFGLSVRAETLRDRDGLVSGTPQTLRSLTISPWYFYREASEGIFSNIEHTTFHLPGFSVRPALRFDHSDVPVFDTESGIPRTTAVTGIIELVYLF
jgi:hypothetical protein